MSTARVWVWGLSAIAMCALAAGCASAPKPSEWVGHIGFGPESQYFVECGTEEDLWLTVPENTECWEAAQRILAESMARTLGPQGVHVAYLAIDAVIDLAWTRKAFADKPDSYFCKPEDIAAECWHLVHQPRSAWTFDVQIRPDGEEW